MHTTLIQPQFHFPFDRIFFQPKYSRCNFLRHNFAEIILNSYNNLTHNFFQVKPDYIQMATVCFSRVVGLEALMKYKNPERVVNLLNDVYHVLDHKIGKYDVFKIDSSGYSYVVASGISFQSLNT